jgi:hypothetical protein
MKIDHLAMWTRDLQCLKVPCWILKATELRLLFERIFPIKRNLK